ncbi:hypothetical protein B0J11DRAFT_558562 [Dendryphion nanum]|uniref:Rhodopsin domain-containing protein n=1 Tax=Dendryphion nanum TaxID=256645 RepID=A0A9P9DY28_9PLEO|nr:hypothetical protein B0J11DRAFT_558562 [Dendryphion nanum]
MIVECFANAKNKGTRVEKVYILSRYRFSVLWLLQAWTLNYPQYSFKMLMGTIYAPAVLGCTIVFVLLDVLVVALRFYNRRKLRQKAQVDDWFICNALVLLIGLASIMIYGVHSRALGYPSPLMDMQGMERRSDGRSSIEEMSALLSLTAKLEYSFLVIAAAALGLVKVGVLVFYRRIFVVDKANFTDARNVIMLTMITLTTLWSAAFCFALMWMCKGDFQAAFQPPAVAASKCVDAPLLGYAFAVSDFISDALIILLPMPFIWKLHLSLGKKLAVAGVFLLGIFASIASLLRMMFMVWSRQVGFDPTMDGELITTASLFWFVVEIAVGIIAACLPTLRGLFKGTRVDSVLRGLRSRLSLGSGSAPSSHDGNSPTSPNSDQSFESPKQWRVRERHDVESFDSVKGDRR